MIIFDIESDGLLDEATKIYVFGWTKDGETVHVETDYDDIRMVLDTNAMAGGHNSFLFDFPLLRKILGYSYQGLKVDTLWLSWYLDPKRSKHSIQSYEEAFGLKKVHVDDDAWKTGNIPLMTERVIEDVKINWKLWKKQEAVLEKLYGN